MTKTPAVFAIPGDITTKTGGYIYERSLLHALRHGGRAVTHLQLPDSFPDPSESDMERAVADLVAIGPGTPLILDGLVLGAIDTDGLGRVAAPICAMIHHPLALEEGLSPQRAAFLAKREADNLALAAHVVVPSPHTAAVLQASYDVPANRISVALPGFPPADPVRLPEEPPLILSVGLLHPRKGHDILLQALARITDLSWRAEIVGRRHDPAHADLLADMIRQLNLSTRVRLTGQISDADLRAGFRAARLFALATRYEGYGMVFGEALCHGLPIVTCRTGAVPDTVPSGAGLLVDPDDPAALAAALRRMLTEADLYEGCTAAATSAARTLPRWADTAAVMDAALTRIAPARAPS